MRHLTLKGIFAIAIGIVFVLSGASVSAADNQSASSAGQLVEPQQVVDGLTGAEVMGEGWFRALSFPKKTNPSSGHGDRCISLGQNGDILLIPGEGPVTCSVEEGSTLLVFGITAFCQDLRPDPDVATNQQAQRDCALAAVEEGLDNISLIVDGGVAQDLHLPQYLVCSPQRTIQQNKNKVRDFTACGYIAWLTDLPVGTHTIRSLATFDDGGSHLFEPDVVITPAG